MDPMRLLRYQLATRTSLLMVALAVTVTAGLAAAPGEAAQRKGAQKKAAKSKAASKPKTCSKMTKGTLVLDAKADEVVAGVTFKRDTGTRHMTLVYDVTGCVLPQTAPKPTQPLAVYPPKMGDEIPDGVIQLARDPNIENGGKRYIVPLEIQSSAIDPGSYSGLVEIVSDDLNPVRTPVALSRSENRLWVPLLWGLLGAAGGFGLFAALALFEGTKPRVSGMLLGLAAVISLIVGAIAALTTSYLNQDVWTSGENAWAAVVIGFTASTSGVMTALLAAVWGDDRTTQQGNAAGRRAGTEEPLPAPPSGRDV